jgi:AbrB family looped-hinge helix DNA binding protein
MFSTITSKGQITLPKGLRAALALEAGDRVQFTPLGEGRYLVTPATGSLCDLKGILPKPSQPVTLKQMEESLREGATL